MIDPVSEIDELQRQLGKWRSYARKWQDIAREKDRDCAEMRKRMKRAEEVALVARRRAEKLLAQYGALLHDEVI